MSDILRIGRGDVLDEIHTRRKDRGTLNIFDRNDILILRVGGLRLTYELDRSACARRSKV